MRELHVVALSEDGRHVVLATRAGTSSGEFRVALDERLTAAVRGELPGPGRDAPPSISPRDIQARLRDGEAPEDIAASAGVPLSRVERYAGPVLAELDRMISGARAAVVSRPRLGPSALPLGEAVEVHLAEVAHLAEGSVRWSARRTEHGRWVVGVSWTARGRRRTAGWHYDPATREVTAVDGPSAVLGHVEAEVAPAAASARTPRPAAPAVSRATGGRTSSRPPTAGAAATGRAVGTPATPASPAPSPRPVTASSRQAARPAAAAAPASARTSSPRPPSARAGAVVAPAPAPAARRRAAPPAAAPAASVPAPGATGRAAPRRTAPRRSAVPALDDLAAGATPGPTRPTGPTAPAEPPAAEVRPAEAAGSPAADQPPAGPPVLRVVPPADPEPATGAPGAPAEERPARRAAGQRSSGRDWADVLMGGGPAAEPRQD